MSEVTPNLALVKMDMKLSVEAVVMTYNGNLDTMDKAIHGVQQAIANAEELAQTAKKATEDLTESVSDLQDKVEEHDKKIEYVALIAEELKKTQEQVAALASQVDEMTQVLTTFRSAFIQEPKLTA